MELFFFPSFFLGSFQDIVAIGFLITSTKIDDLTNTPSSRQNQPRANHHERGKKKSMVCYFVSPRKEKKGSGQGCVLGKQQVQVAVSEMAQTIQTKQLAEANTGTEPLWHRKP